jgi:phosphoheptose isomerase
MRLAHVTNFWPNRLGHAHYTQNLLDAIHRQRPDQPQQIIGEGSTAAADTDAYRAIPCGSRSADYVDDVVRALREAGADVAYLFGNGGSAADAQHLAAELECRYAFDRRPLPALALHANTSTVTAVSNDYAYEDLFARLLRAHVRPGDVAIASTTSGTSKNVLAAARLREELDFRLIGLTGGRTS